MKASIAAGHPATVSAGAEILAAGGTAADAAVAASIASCVAETVMTGLLGGGHAIYFDATAGRAENLDFFVAVPGLGKPRRDVELLELEVPFGAELVHYAVGPQSCGVHGVPAGLGELWRRYGRLEWSALAGPALRLASAGVEMPAAHAACLAMLAPVMTMNDGGRIYSPGGALLAAGDRLEQPGLVCALELVADEGPRSFYRGAIAEKLLELMAQLGGLVTGDDLAAYEARWRDPVDADYLGLRVATRGDLSHVPETLIGFPELRGLDEATRAVALASAISSPAEGGGHTTNITVTDADGNACVLTTSLGLGSGDFVPGLDLHLNSMLGETDLLRGELAPGDRMGSMMAPTLAFDGDKLVLAIGAAGGTRLRGALLQVAAGVLDEKLPLQEAVDRPRLHPAAGRVQLEPGFSEAAIEALAAAGFEPRVWAERHHFFGGVSAVTRSAAAGDPRRSGAAATVP
jgi:gamma-glutamyltranspeptidase / glutathione hydrolase